MARLDEPSTEPRCGADGSQPFTSAAIRASLAAGPHRSHLSLGMNMQLRITAVLISTLCAWLAVADEPQPHMGFSNRLAEVVFALDDLPTGGLPDGGHTVLVFYITDHTVGFGRSIYNYAEQGGGSDDTNSVAMAAECASLLRTLVQPKGVPESPNHIITARAVDGGKVIERKFSIHRVPPEIHRILNIMRWHDQGSRRLTFLDGTRQSIATNAVHRIP
jgi:hypothetical protein